MTRPEPNQPATPAWRVVSSGPLSRDTTYAISVSGPAERDGEEG